MTPLQLSTGLDVLLEDPSLLRGRRIGLLANAASVTSDYVPAAAALQMAGLDVRVLFGPEHGYWGAAQD
ncbi:MAG: exo-beta-N-acetylmuramidase NamZ domain-containing protein, partial [Acidithiobacillales bacterium]